MPRRHFTPTQWKVTLPEQLAARVEHRLGNISAGKVAYGARSALISALLQNWLLQLDQRPTLTIPSPSDPDLVTKLETIRDTE